MELSVYSNGIIRGFSILFSADRLSLLGIGRLDGKTYYSFDELKKNKFKFDLENLYVYLKETDKKDPLPWKAKTLNYKIEAITN